MPRQLQPYAGGRVAPYAVNAGALRSAYAGVQRAYKAYKSYKSRQAPRFAPETVDPGPITSRYDFTTDYRKRRQSKRQRRKSRRKRKWQRRIVNTVRAANIGSSHMLRRSFSADVTAAANTQGTASFTIYGLNGTNNPNLNTTNDMGQFMYDISNADWNNWDSATLTSKMHRIHSFHATMEFNMVNTGESDAFVEVYFIRAKSRQAASWGDPTNVYNVGFLKQGVTTDPNSGNPVGSELTPTELGVTPFQNSLFCRFFTIYKRQKYRISPGAEVSFVHMDRRVRTFTIGGVKPFAWGKGTSGVLIQWQGVAVGGGVPSPAASSAMTFNVTRRYRFKFVRDDQPTDGRD